jgi:hypothetical protein
LPRHPSELLPAPHQHQYPLYAYPVALPLRPHGRGVNPHHYYPMNHVVTTLHGHVMNPQHPPKIGFLPHCPHYPPPTSHVPTSRYPVYENQGQTAESIASN